MRKFAIVFEEAQGAVMVSFINDDKISAEQCEQMFAHALLGSRQIRALVRNASAVLHLEGAKATTVQVDDNDLDKMKKDLGL